MSEAPAGPAIPAKYRPFVEQAAAKHRLFSVELIGAQIQVESGWNPRAESPSGAQGIAQFMPAMWKVWGKDDSGDGRADVFDPADAIPALGRHMAALVDDFKKYAPDDVSESLRLALAGWMAGPGAVHKYKGVPPFPEVKDYVDRVWTVMNGG